jgi:regulator of sigma E protease
MTALWYLLWFLIAVSLLVTVHEFGHYWVARRLGFKVLRFSVGFGKPIFSWRGKRDQIEYWICPIPLGGYVKMLDEREGPVPPQELSRSFTRQHPLKRILVLLAGPGSNFLFAIAALSVILWTSGITRYLPVIGAVRPGSIAARAGIQPGDRVLAINGRPVDSERQVVLRLLDVMSGNGDARLTVQARGSAPRIVNLDVRNPAERRALTGPKDPLHGLGMHFWEPVIPPVLGKVLPGGPAARAGLRAGDRIVAIDGRKMSSFAALVAAVSPNPGKTLAITYRRGARERTVKVTTARVTVAGRVIGRIDAEQPLYFHYPSGMVRTARLGPLGAVRGAVQRIWTLTVLQTRLLWRMVLGRVSIKNIGGPLTIAEDAGQSASAGAGSFTEFLVLISMELGLLNLLPIPVLDGGQIVIQAIEWVKGAPLSERAQIIGQQVGIALLILLMGVAVFNDIVRQFG